MSQYHGSEAMRVPGVDVGTRATFIVRTYNHLFGAILGFTLLELFLFKSGIAETLAGSSSAPGSPWRWSGWPVRRSSCSLRWP